MRITTKRTLLGASAAFLAVTMLAGCSNAVGGSGNDDESSTGASDSADSGDSAVIGLLLPDNVTERYASADKPYIEEKIKDLCSDCTMLYANADADAAKQQQQAESMLTEGVDVLLLDPFDGKAAAAIVNRAQQQDVPVISYDRLINSPDVSYYISFDNVKVGELQAQALVDRMDELGLPDDAGILMSNGSPTDPNAAQFKKGAHNVIDDTDLTVLGEYDTKEWKPSKTQDWVAGQVSKFGNDIKGMYVANDNTAGGAIAALKAGGVDPLPPVTGQDAALSGIQHILSGDQYMTVYKAFKPEAYKAAELAVDLAQGKSPEADTTAKTADGDEVPSFLLDPVVVTVDNIKDTVVKDGLYTIDEICTDAYAKACEEHGLK